MKKILLAALLMAATVTHAPAQTYPDRPIKLLVPLAAASAVDIVARLVGDKMGETLGQRLYIENQVGAAGALGMRAASRSAPDGYTIAIISCTFFAWNAGLAIRPSGMPTSCVIGTKSLSGS